MQARARTCADNGRRSRGGGGPVTPTEYKPRPPLRTYHFLTSAHLLESGSMRALYIIVPILGILVIAYRYYSAFIAAKLWGLDDLRTPPAPATNDGKNFFPSSRCVLFGHHFPAIAGAG